MLHTFQKGHRIMVQIQSTWFPLVDRNPQKYVPNIYAAKDDDFVKATHKVYRSTEQPTRIEFGVLPAGDISSRRNRRVPDLASGRACARARRMPGCGVCQGSRPSLV